jgi:hypothetical protein
LRAIGVASEVGKDHPFKTEMDEEAKPARFPSNDPESAM